MNAKQRIAELEAEIERLKRKLTQAEAEARKWEALAEQQTDLLAKAFEDLAEIQMQEDEEDGPLN